MLLNLKKKMLIASVAMFTGTMSGVESAFADTTAGRKDFTTIIGNIDNSISGFPGLISGGAYMIGVLLGVLGILKIKDHVENPGQTKLQDGAVRLAAGGALFALPIVYEAMQQTIGTGSGVKPTALEAVQMTTIGDGVK